MKSRRPLRAACLALCLALAACGSDADEPGSGGAAGSGESGEKQVRIAYFGVAAANAYTQYMYKGAEAEAKRLGATIEFIDGKFDGAVQIGQIQDAVTSGRYDALIIMPNDLAGVAVPVKAAIAKGIKVAALQFPIGTDPATAEPQVPGLTTSVIEDVVEGARITAQGLIEACEGVDPCEVGMLWGSRPIPWEAAKVKPFKDTLATAPNVRLVAEADAGFVQSEGRKAMADFLQAHPDLMAVGTTGDQMIRGAEAAITAAGKSFGTGPNDIKLIGYGASEMAVKRVKEGRWLQSYVLVPQTMARTAVQRIVAAVNGEDVEPATVQVDLSPVGEVVTKESLAEHPDFTGEWDG